MMGNRVVRLLVGVIVAEAVPVMILIVAVAVLGPGERVADQVYAAKLGSWVGPIAGAVATFLLAWWVTQPLTGRHIQYGAMVGTLVAALDTSIIIASGPDLRWLFVFSQIGRVIAGVLGGVAAARATRNSW